MSSFRALETDEQAADRMSVDRACKAKKRVLETEEEAFERKSHDRACKAKKRALETEEEAFERKSHDRASKGNKSTLACMCVCLLSFIKLCLLFSYLSNSLYLLKPFT